MLPLLVSPRFVINFLKTLCIICSGQFKNSNSPLNSFSFKFSSKFLKITLLILGLHVERQSHILPHLNQETFFETKKGFHHMLWGSSHPCATLIPIVLPKLKFFHLKWDQTWCGGFGMMMVKFCPQKLWYLL